MESVLENTEEEIREEFRIFDKDGDGYLSANELNLVMKTLGNKATDEEADEMMRKAGIDEDSTENSKGNGTTDFPEFLTIMASHLENTEEDVREAFREFDKDSDGFITADELRLIMVNYGYKATDEDLDEMIREADIDEDGKVNYEEMIGPIKNLLEQKKKEQENERTTSETGLIGLVQNLLEKK
ncbi:uncharacterized protein LOC143987097 [Lithobates pipiens]